MAPEDDNTQEIDFEAQMLELASAYEQQQTAAKADTRVLDQLEELAGGQDELKAALHALSQRLGSCKEGVESLQPAVKRTAAMEQLLLSLLDEIKRKNSLESANEKLFAAMHQELRGYKDGFLFEALQKPIVQDLLQLLDDLEQLSRPLEEAVTSTDGVIREALDPVCNNLSNTTHFLLEILNRLDVERIMEVEQFDKRIHRAVEVRAAESSEQDGMIVKIVRGGYRWRDRLIRPVDVVIKKLPSDGLENIGPEAAIEPQETATPTPPTHE